MRLFLISVYKDEGVGFSGVQLAEKLSDPLWRCETSNQLQLTCATETEDGENCDVLRERCLQEKKLFKLRGKRKLTRRNVEASLTISIETATE